MIKYINKKIKYLWGRSIRHQLMLVFAVSTAVLMLGFSFSQVWHERAFLMAQSLQHTRNLAHTVAVSSTSWVVANDVSGLQEVLRSSARSPNLKYALVLSPEGKVLASTRAEDIGRFVHDSISNSLLRASPQPIVLVDDANLADVAEPVMAGGRFVGWVRIGWGREDVAHNLQAVTRQGYVMVTIAVLITLLVAFMISRGLTAGLLRLVAVADQVRGGGRDARADVARDDELGMLAGNFNVMLDELTESERKLEKLNRVYAAWTECSDVTVRETDRQRLLERICQILAQHVPFDLVWVGMLQKRSYDIVKVASSHPSSDYLRDIRVSADPARADGRGPMGTAIREGCPQIYNDFLNHPESLPWRAMAEREGFHAVASFPLNCGAETIGAVSVYTRELEYFDREVVTLLHGLTEDISFALGYFERERLRSEAEAKVQLAAKVFEHSKEGIMVSDADGNIVSVNHGFTEITGYSQQEVLGKNPALLASGRHDRGFFAAMWESVLTLGSWQGEVWNRRKSGVIYPAWLTITCMRNEAGEVSNYIGIFSDISERKMAEERIQHLAHYDALTDLPNRVLFRDRLEQAIIKSQRSNEKLAVIFLDLDRFKQINDTLGHSVGDRLLQVVATRLLECVRGQDTVSRQGGDEFLVMLPGATPEGAAMVAQKMLMALAAPCLIDGHDLRVTPSIGISMYPEDAKDIDALVKLADVAMYHAKDLGRNNYQFYTESLNATAFERLSLESGLRMALERNEFLLHYQPQVDLASGRVIGCEALIRWKHPEYGMVSPARFIPVAEESGLIIEIGEWVLREACRQLRAWQDAGHTSLVMAVNMSALQFRKPGLEEVVLKALNDAGVLAQSLELELTESILMHGIDTTLATLQKFAALGLQLSIDDFGTGYSSLSYLKRFPIHKLKIDQSFVRDIATDVNDAAIVRTIVLMAHSLNLRVIAEGVETNEQQAFLREAGCDEIQGYLFSRPLPAEGFEALLGEGKRS